jgi:hypothetical protein
VHAWQDKNFIHVFFSGNEGASAANDGEYANIPALQILQAILKWRKIL